MFNGIKKLATRKVLIPLVILEMLFLIAGTAIKIIAFDGIYMDYFPDIRLGTLFTNIFNAIPVIILLLATIFFHSPKADLLFKISLIASVSISIAISLFDLIAPDVLGFVIMGVGKNIIGTLILSVPIIFIVVDCFQKHKYITASCWVAIIMLGLQIFSIFADWVMGSLYGHFTLCFALKSVIHWLIILIYLSQHITKRKMEQKASPVSIEGQLQIIKQKYESGEITQEEYREQKAELLKRL
jgi:uncharacterized membrane protein